MNRILPVAVLLIAAALAPARADEGAYGSLMGMAQSARQDRGPDADDGSAPARDEAMRDALKDAVAQPPAPAPRAAADAPKPSEPAADASRPAAVSVPASPAPRLWTRLYSSLLPSWRRAPVPASEFEAPSSTRAVPSPAASAPALPDAVKAGERRGLAELMSTSVAPADPE